MRGTHGKFQIPNTTSSFTGEDCAGASPIAIIVALRTWVVNRHDREGTVSSFPPIFFLSLMAHPVLDEEDSALPPR
jgi:hypothetical protein